MLPLLHANPSIKALITTIGALFLSTTVTLAADTETEALNNQNTAVDLDAFPAPEANYERHIIRLPVGNYENNLKIELLPGKVQEIDCNPTHYTGQLTEKTLEGWGYNYYELSELSGPVSTKMACPDEEKSFKFIPVITTGSLLEYNSRLPVVVYLPEGLELRWRTWVATPYNTATIN